MANTEIEIAVAEVINREKSYGIYNLKDELIWIPKSQVSDYCGEEDNPETIFIPEWLAIKKDLI